MSLQVFWVSSEPQEPLYEPHACLAISRYSASPVSHRSHYMNLMYSYLYTGILDPQLPHIPIYHHHVHLAIPTLSGSPVSHRSHQINHTYLAISGHSGSPVSPRGHCISMPFTSRNFKSSGSLVSHRSHYMNYTWMVCRLSHRRPSWSPVNPVSQYINDLQI